MLIRYSNSEVFGRKTRKFVWQTFQLSVLIACSILSGCFKGYSITDVTHDSKMLEEAINVAAERGTQIIDKYTVLQSTAASAQNNLPVKIVPKGWTTVSVGHKDSDTSVTLQVMLDNYTDGVLRLRLYDGANRLLELVDRTVTFEPNVTKTVTFDTRYSLDQSSFIVLEYNQHHSKLFNSVTWPPTMPSKLPWSK
jgi:hypothetical protein